MLYTSYPDTAVFKLNGRTVSSKIRWNGTHGVLELTGEKLRDVMRRVDSAFFYRNGEEVDATPADCSFEAAL